VRERPPGRNGAVIDEELGLDTIGSIDYEVDVSEQRWKVVLIQSLGPGFQRQIRVQWD
jgi:hypothetical protein